MSAGKCIYPAIWRWLPLQHTGRTARAAAINRKPGADQPDHRTAQVPARRQVSELRPGSNSHADEEAKQRADKNVFWKLPYWYHLGPTNLTSYDGMHTTAGIMKDLFACVDPSKDNRVTQAVKTFEKDHNG
jgi:hypothetical protein